jgi:phosphatidylethanolamine/phosphatidyl-N-methylethanolamine N-methyltransferase
MENSKEDRRETVIGSLLAGVAMSVADVMLFLREWLRNPKSVAAIAPSGRALASLITREISSSTGPVIEIGPGTGVFTEALLKRGVRRENLTLVEYGSEFARVLQMRFPGVRVLWMDATQLCRHKLYDGAPVGAVISGLGFLNMPDERIAVILEGAFEYLRPDGVFFLFTYGPRCSVPDALLAGLGLEATCVGKTFRNFPPASVHRIARRQPSQATG